MKEDEKANCVDLDRRRRITDKDAQDIILKLCGTKNSAEFQSMDKAERDQCIAILKTNGLSLRQISRLTGISFGIVRKG